MSTATSSRSQSPRTSNGAIEPSDSSYYMLERDRAAAKRLNIFHRNFNCIFGDIYFHPAVSVGPPGTRIRVADIACGTGIWLSELSDEFVAQGHEPEDVTFDGWDICPNTSSGVRLPRNVTLRSHSILDPFPEKFIGSYDAVHVRATAVFLGRDEWEQALRNIVTLIRPGGYLQWEEGVVGDMRSRPEETSSFKVLRDVMIDAFVENGKDTECGVGLMNLFPRCGLRIVHSKTLSTGGKGDISRAMSKIMATTFKEVALALIRGGFTQATGEMETVEDAEKHAETLMSEIEEGKVGIEWDVIRVVGRKPMKRSGRKTGLRAWAKRVVGRDAR